MKKNINASVSPIPKSTQAIFRYSWHFWLWMASSLLAALIVTVILTAWSVRHVMIGGGFFSVVQSRVVIAVAEFPGLVHATVKQLRSQFGIDPLPLLKDRKVVEQSNWIRRFPSTEDSGYLLFSGTDPALKRSIVKLIRISDGVTVALWDPDWSDIFKRITSKKYAPVGDANSAQAVHPLLLDNGDITFNMMGAGMVRMGTCSTKPIWVLDEVMHHSNELDESGVSIWVPSVSQDGFFDNDFFRNRIRDDALAQVSTDGRVLKKLSFVRILRDNDLQMLLSGAPGDADVVHINQIQVAHQDSRYWHRGDLLISAARTSTVYLYRPSTGKIIWHQSGPWMSQHSVDFVDDHRISVFDNNVMYGGTRGHAFFSPNDINRVILYDFDTKQAAQPFAAMLGEAKPITITEGRARVLPDGGLFVEETNNGRHLRFTRDRLLWSRVNDYDENRIGAVAWSRYLTAEEARAPLKALASKSCMATAEK